MNIILSIHPKWAQKIHTGEKTVEWRKGSPKRINPSKVFIYETAPVCKVTGYIVLEGFAGLNINHASVPSFLHYSMGRKSPFVI